MIEKGEIVMEEQKIVKKQLIKNMFLTFLVFTILCLLFDFIIYNQVSRSLFKSIDKDLISSMDFYQSPQEEQAKIIEYATLPNNDQGTQNEGEILYNH